MKHTAPRPNTVSRVIVALACLLALAARAGETLRHEPISPIPLQHGQDPRRVELGARLFHDPRLSADNSVSCATCHRLAAGGADGLPRSIGIGGAKGVVKTPTVFNSGFNLAQGWDGRARSLEAQIEGPVHNPVRMGSSWPEVTAKLARDEEYPGLFRAIYNDGIRAEHVKDAIAAFERSLTTPNSRFDRWLRGEADALSAHELEGYALFKSYGCVACHQGVNVGGNLYQRMGTLGDYFADRGGGIQQADLGGVNVTGREKDRHYFKVPSLRLAVLNPPYFHDGSAATALDAVRAMARYQLGRRIPDEDAAAITAFLGTLVGEHPRLGP